MAHFHSLIADDRRSAVAADIISAYRRLRWGGMSRPDARAIANARRMHATFSDDRVLTVGTEQYGPGRGLRGRCTARPRPPRSPFDAHRRTI